LLVAIEQRELVDEDGAQGKALGVAESLGRHRPVDPENAFEMFVKVLHRQGPQRVEDPTDLDAAIGVGMGPAPGRDQDLVSLQTELAEIGIVVVDVAQDVPIRARMFDALGASVPSAPRAYPAFPA
jgi:hypothetical protein